MASERRTPLLLKREQSASRLVEDGMDEMEDDKKWPSARDGLPRLLTKAQVPTWYKQAFIHSGYRPVTGSVRSCFASLGHVHNETVNVFSHLVPATLALVGVFYMPSYLGSRFPQASWVDQLVLALYLSTTVLCFTASALYHTLLCHSQRYFDLWVRIDYVAIILQILGSFVSGIYIGFYCEPVLQWLYWSMIVILSVLSAFVVLHPRMQSPRWRLVRLSTFVGTGLSAFAPIMHAVAIFPYAQLDKQSGLRYYLIEGVFMAIGATLYGTRFPESRWPGRFDLIAASHQLFHGFVVLGAAVHLYGISTAFEWNYENPRCPSFHPYPVEDFEW